MLPLPRGRRSGPPLNYPFYIECDTKSQAETEQSIRKNSYSSVALRFLAGERAENMAKKPTIRETNTFFLTKNRRLKGTVC